MRKGPLLTKFSRGNCPYFSQEGANTLLFKNGDVIRAEERLGNFPQIFQTGKANIIWGPRQGPALEDKPIQPKTLLGKLTRNAASRLDKSSALLFDSLELRTGLRV